MPESGYSKTPLFKKLGTKSGDKILCLFSPKDYEAFFEYLPDNLEFISEDQLTERIDFIHLFVKSQQELKNGWTKAVKFLKKDGILWVSWPKQSSSISTEIGKYDIMKYGLDQGLVDVKVAAIDEDWSGLKFIYRKKDR